jgi:peptidoglycan/xylan/chitin deacetylase (PgdA/CDA1 family)
MYHQIAEKPVSGTPLRGLVVSPSNFAQHMAALSFMGFKGMSMTDLMPYLSGEQAGKVFGITFDDGYENVLKNALPVLQRYRFTSTNYVVPRLAGKSNLWDEKNKIPQVPLMTTRQMQEWIDAGQEVGSHTLTHANLKEASGDQIYAEVVNSKLELENIVKQKNGIQHFCYPYGATSIEAVNAAKSAGYQSATTTERGRVLNTAGIDNFLLPRVLVSRTTTWPQLLWKCLGTYEDKRNG